VTRAEALLRLLAGLALLLAAPARADVGPALATLMAEDARLQSLGWGLARANAPFCADAPPGVGLLLLDAANFRDPSAIRAALGLSGDIAVGAVAAGSPAARAGLRAGEEVLAINGEPMDRLAHTAPGDPLRLAGLHQRIEQALAAHGAIALTLSDRTVTLTGEPACASRFELALSGRRAVAEGSRVVIGRDALNANPVDAEAAVIVAHELAHNVLRHRLRLEAGGRLTAEVRRFEREADRLAVWLLANAGHDPQAAIRLAEGWLRAGDKGVFRAPTHDGWQARRDLMAREVEAIAQARKAQPQGPLDWRRRFPLPTIPAAPVLR
jgi:membrane-associated protease RseP (regulator of RpoE activity)